MEDESKTEPTSHELISICNRRPTVWFLMCLDNLSALLVTRFSLRFEAVQKYAFQHEQKCTQPLHLIARSLCCLYFLYTSKTRAPRIVFYPSRISSSSSLQRACLLIASISKYHVDKCRYTVQVFTINNKRTTLLSIFAKIINHAFSSLLRSFHFVSIRHPTIPSLIARISIILFRLYNSSISTTGNDT